MACKRTSVVVSVAAPVEIQPEEKPVFEVRVTAVALVVPGADARVTRRAGCLLTTKDGTSLVFWSGRGCHLVVELICFDSVVCTSRMKIFYVIHFNLC